MLILEGPQKKRRRSYRLAARSGMNSAILDVNAGVGTER